MTDRTRRPGEPRDDDPDHEALMRVLAGDPEAYGEVVARHEGMLRSLVAGIVGDRHLVEDVLQDSFLLAYRRLADFRGDARFGTWLTRITIREATRMRTRFRSGWKGLVPLEEGVADGDGRDDRPSEGREEVLAILARLPERERVPFVLHVLEGRSYVEIADLLGYPSGTVGSHISRARARLRRMLPSPGGGVVPLVETRT